MLQALDECASIPVRTAIQPDNRSPSRDDYSV